MVSNIVFSPKVNIGEKIGVIYRGNISYSINYSSSNFITWYTQPSSHKILVYTIIMFISNPHYIKLRIEYIVHTDLFRLLNMQVQPKESKQTEWQGHRMNQLRGREDLWQIRTGAELIQVLLFEQQSEKGIESMHLSLIKLYPRYVNAHENGKSKQIFEYPLVLLW